MVRTQAEAIHITPTRGGVHSVALEFPRGLVTCLELKAGVADAVVARLAMIGALDFTARDERFATFSVEVDKKPYPVALSVRSGQGHLEAYVRRSMPPVVKDESRRFGPQPTP